MPRSMGISLQTRQDTQQTMTPKTIEELEAELREERLRSATWRNMYYSMHRENQRLQREGK